MNKLILSLILALEYHFRNKLRGIEGFGTAEAILQSTISYSAVGFAYIKLILMTV